MRSRTTQAWVSQITATVLAVFLTMTTSVSAQSPPDADSQEQMSLEWFVGTDNGESKWIGQTPYSEKILDEATEAALALSYGGCSNSEIRTVQGACRYWYGARSRGVHYCSREPDGYVYFACAVAH